MQSWPKERVGISAVWMHTSPSNTAAAGGLMAWIPARVRPHWSGMPTALVAGRGTLRVSGTVLRPCPLQDLGGQLPTGPSWSPCGTVCGKAPTRRAPRAKGLVGSIVPAHMAGSAQHRWAFSLWLSLKYWKKARVNCVRLEWFGNFTESSLLTGYECLGKKKCHFHTCLWLHASGWPVKVRRCCIQFLSLTFPQVQLPVLRWFYCFASWSILSSLVLGALAF